MENDENLRPKVLIAQSKVRIFKAIIREILRVEPAGSKKEDEWVQEQIRKQDKERKRREENNKPQTPTISNPPKAEIRLPTFPVYSTLPERPIIQPIPIPPYQQPIDLPNPDNSTISSPEVDSGFEELKRRAEKERDEAKQAKREQAQKNQEEKIRAERERLEKDQSEEQKRQSNKRQDEIIKGLEEINKELERANNRIRGEVLPVNKIPFGIPVSYILQISGSSNEIAFGDKLAKTILLSMETGVLKEEILKSMQELLTPESLAAMGGFIAVVGSANLAAAAIAPPIGPAIAAVVDAAMAVLIIGGNGATLWEASTALAGFLTKANGAKTDADFLEAAKDFAKFANAVGPDVVSKMTGAAAGKALGAIGSKLASVGSDLGKLLPEKQKQIGDGLRVGGDLLNKVGRKITDGFSNIFKHIDETLRSLAGDKSKNLTGNTGVAPNPGGKDPKKKDKKVQPSRWDKVTDEIKAKMKEGAEANELAIDLNKLKAKGLNPETVGKLYGQGIPPSVLDKLLEDTRKFTLLRSTKGRGKRNLDSAVKPEFQELVELTNKFLSQTLKPSMTDEKKSKVVKKAKDFIQYAVSDRQIYKFAKEILNSGKLDDTKGLSQAVENFATQSTISGALGYQFETEFAAQLVRSGRKISMGSGADVVDHTNKQAWQLKNVDGNNAFNGVLNKAAKQLTGENGEQPPLGYLKNIKLRITGKENPEYLKSPKQLEESIKESISSNTGGKWENVNQVQIIIDNKTHIFDIRKNKEGVSPTYKKTYQSAPHTIGELPTEIRVAGVRNISPQLLSALEKYQQVVKNSPTPEQHKERQIAHQVALAKQSEDIYERLNRVNHKIWSINTELKGQTFNLNEISPNILRNASFNDPKAVAYASALLLKNSGRKAFVSKESELELVKVNDTGLVTLYSHLLSVNTAQNILEAAQKLQQKQTTQANRSNSNQREMGG